MKPIFCAIACALLPASLFGQIASFSIPSQSLEQGAQNVQIPVQMDTSRAVYAFSLSLEVTRSQLRLDGVDLTGTVAAGAEFMAGQAKNNRGRYSFGAILDETPPIDGFIRPANDLLLARIIVDVDPTAAGETVIRFRDFAPDLSTVPADPGGQNVVAGATGNAMSLATSDGHVTIGRPGIGPFLRGDCNQDGESPTITDALYYLNFVFSTGPDPICRAACDFDGNGQVEASPTDALFYLGWAFLGGGPPPEPRRTCNISTRRNDLTIGCENPAGCR